MRCKHCGEPIKPEPGHADFWLHEHGLERCQSVVEYGHHAEPIGQPCRADQPNPCRGASLDAM